MSEDTVIVRSERERTCCGSVAVSNRSHFHTIMSVDEYVDAMFALHKPTSKDTIEVDIGPLLSVLVIFNLEALEFKGMEVIPRKYAGFEKEIVQRLTTLSYNESTNCSKVETL